ncbi:phage integrase central domain-containing protein [Nocardioides sp. NPDC101246]|uniref:phage integrase central domain-containing protein n=1 Tax=Nocardioides sp. NPDC101246 TaxID=3364336 RepID=UPI0037F1AA33
MRPDPDAPTSTSPEARKTARTTTPTTFEEYAAAWLPARMVKGRPLAPRTRSDYEDLLRLHILPAFGNAPLADITSEAIDKWYGNTAVGRDTTRARAYGLLRTILGTAVERGLIKTGNPAKVRGGGSVTRRHDIRPAAPHLQSECACVDPPRVDPAGVVLAVAGTDHDDAQILPTQAPAGRCLRPTRCFRQATSTRPALCDSPARSRVAADMHLEWTPCITRPNDHRRQRHPRRGRRRDHHPRQQPNARALRPTGSRTGTAGFDPGPRRWVDDRHARKLRKHIRLPST